MGPWQPRGDLADLVFLGAQTGWEPLLAYDWEVDRRTYIRLLGEYDETRDARSLVEFIPVVLIEKWTTEYVRPWI